MQISSGFRSNEDQAYIYGQGRPNYIWNGKVYGSEGSIVSNAPPGLDSTRPPIPVQIAQAVTMGGVFIQYAIIE